MFRREAIATLWLEDSHSRLDEIGSDRTVIGARMDVAHFEAKYCLRIEEFESD